MVYIDETENHCISGIERGDVIVRFQKEDHGTQGFRFAEIPIGIDDRHHCNLRSERSEGKINEYWTI